MYSVVNNFIIGKEKGEKGCLRVFIIFCNRMDSISIILWFIIVYVILRNWYLVKCEVFLEFE